MKSVSTSRILGLTTSEWKRSLPFIIYLFFISMGITIGRSARDALFLLHPSLGAPLLPWMYLLSSLVGLLPPILFSTLESRFNLKQVSIAFLIFFGGSALLSRFLSAEGSGVGIATLYILIQSVMFIVYIPFWSLVSECFDPREAKRIFPVIGASSMIGTIAGGFFCKFFTQQIGTENMFSIWIFLSFLSGIVLFKNIFPGLQLEERNSKRSSRKANLKEEFEETWKHSLSKNLLIYILILGPLCSIVNYQFSMTSAATYLNRNELTSFLGYFNGLVGAISIFLQFLVTPFLIRKFGLGRAMLIHPFFLTLSILGMAFQFGFKTATLANGLNMVLLSAIHDSVVTLLLNALSSQSRAQARNIILGMSRPITSAIAFLVMKTVMIILTASLFNFFLSLLSATGLFYALGIRKNYLKALLNTLSTHSRQVIESEETFRSRESLEALKLNIVGSDPLKAVSSIQIAADLKIESLKIDIWEVLRSKSPLVRCAAVEAFGSYGNPKDRQMILEVAKDKDPHVREAAIESAGLLGATSEQIIPFIEDSNALVRSAAIVALLYQGEKNGMEKAQDSLEKMTASQDPEERAMAVKILGEARLRDFVPILLALSKDLNLKVQRRAARALGRIGDASSATALVQFLEDPYLEKSARYSLTHGIGKKAVPALIQGIKSGSKEIRRGSAKALAEIAEEECENPLLELSLDEDSLIRDNALLGLSMIKSHSSTDIPMSYKEHLKTIVDEETKNAYLNRIGRKIIELKFQNPSGKFLVGTMIDDELASLKRAILAIGLLSRPQSALKIWERLESGVKSILYQLREKRLDYKRAIAIEAFENLEFPEKTKPILSLLDPQGQEEEQMWSNKYLSAHAHQIDFYLNTFCSHPSGVVRATLALSILQSNNERDNPWFNQLQNDQSKIVSEIINSYNKNVMMTTIEKIIFLRGVQFFQFLDRAGLSRIASITVEVNFKAGTPLFSAGDPGDALYLIVKGRVRITAPSGRTLALLTNPDCFGEMSILDDEKRSASATSDNDCSLLKITRDDFRELILEEPQISFGVFQLLSSRLRESINTPIPSSIPNIPLQD